MTVHILNEQRFKHPQQNTSSLIQQHTDGNHRHQEGVIQQHARMEHTQSVTVIRHLDNTEDLTAWVTSV
jgi:hypothetical protein